jgi:hypothetical protein
MERQEGDDAAATAAAEEEVVVQIGAQKHDPAWKHCLMVRAQGAAGSPRAQGAGGLPTAHLLFPTLLFIDLWLDNPPLCLVVVFLVLWI